MDKVKISLTVTVDTLTRIDRLCKLLVRHVEISRGDVMDILVAEKFEQIHPGTLVEIFAENSAAKGE